MAALGAVTGGVASTSSDLLTGNPQLEELMAKIGGAGAITDMLLSTMGVLAGLIVGGYAISAALRMSGEEIGRPARPGAGHRRSAGRGGWPATCCSSCSDRPCCWPPPGVVGGLINGALVGDMAGGFGAALGAMLVQIPATLVLGGLAVALFGWLPRFTSLAWAGAGGRAVARPARPAAAAAAVADGPLAVHATFRWSRPQEVRWTPLIVLTAVAAALIGVGIAGFRRRDV